MSPAFSKKTGGTCFLAFRHSVRPSVRLSVRPSFRPPIGVCTSCKQLCPGARMDPRGTVGRIYKEDHYTLLHTKYESSGPCCCGGEDFCPPPFRRKPEGHVFWLSVIPSVRPSVRPSVLSSPYRSMYLVQATPPIVL